MLRLVFGPRVLFLDGNSGECRFVIGVNLCLPLLTSIFRDVARTLSTQLFNLKSEIGLFRREFIPRFLDSLERIGDFLYFLFKLVLIEDDRYFLQALQMVKFAL